MESILTRKIETLIFRLEKKFLPIAEILPDSMNTIRNGKNPNSFFIGGRQIR